MDVYKWKRGTLVPSTLITYLPGFLARIRGTKKRRRRGGRAEEKKKTVVIISQRLSPSPFNSAQLIPFTFATLHAKSETKPQISIIIMLYWNWNKIHAQKKTPQL